MISLQAKRKYVVNQTTIQMSEGVNIFNWKSK